MTERMENEILAQNVTDLEDALRGILIDAKYAERQLKVFGEKDGKERAKDAIERIVEKCESVLK